MAEQKYTSNDIIAALRAERGVLMRAGKRLGCSDETIRNYARRYPKVAEAIDEARGALVDLAEDGLAAALEAREAWAIGLTLRTLGRERGYVERSEQDVAGDVTVRVEYADDTA